MTRTCVLLSALLAIGCNESDRKTLVDSVGSGTTACVPLQSCSVAAESTEMKRAYSGVSAEAATLRSNGRKALPFKLVLLWSRPGSMTDSVMFQPADLAIDDKSVYLSDFSGGRIIALKVENGNFSWSFGRPGDGPGEFRGLSSFAGIRGDTISIWNRAHSRVTELLKTGELTRTRQINEAARVYTVCIFSDGTMFGNRSMGIDSMMIARVPTDGVSEPKLWPLPWKEIQSSPAIAAQFVLHPVNDEGCLVTPSYWSAAARIHMNGQFADSLQMVEQVAFPTATKGRARAHELPHDVDKKRAASAWSTQASDQSVHTTIDATRLTEYTVVAFEGSTRLRRRLLDFYRSSSGEYAGSFLMNGNIRSVAGLGHRLAVISEDDLGLFRLDVFRIEK